MTIIMITVSNTVHCAKYESGGSSGIWIQYATFRIDCNCFITSVSVVTVVWHCVTMITTITILKRLRIQLSRNTYTGPTPMLTVCKCRISSLYAYCPISNI